MSSLLATLQATCRDQEVKGIKAEDLWKFDPESASFKKADSGGQTADLQSDLKWQFCLKRRGLAYDQAMVLSWEVHETWLALLTDKRRVAILHH